MYRAWPVLMFAAHRFSLVTVNSQWAAETFVRKYQNNDAVMCHGERDSFTVTPDEFMAFHDAYMKYEYRKRVIGTADLDGRIVYHFEKDGKTTN